MGWPGEKRVRITPLVRDRGRRFRQLLQVGPQPGRSLRQHVLPGHQRRQVTPHPHAPGRQRVRRVEGPLGHRQRLGVAEHDGRRPGLFLGGIEPEAGPPAVHGEDQMHVATRRHVLGHAGDDLHHAEGAVGRGQRAGAGRGDRVGQVERAQRAVEGLHPLG